MRYLKALLLVGALALTQTAPSRVEAAVDVPALITEAALTWGVSPAVMRRVAWCESRFYPLAYNRSGASGLFQMMPRTWAYASWGAGFGGSSPFDPVANAYSAAWLAATSGLHHWRACL